MAPFGSQFEGTVHHGGEGMETRMDLLGQEKPEAAGHAVSAVGKQRAMDEDARPFFSFFFSPLAQSIGMVTAIPALLNLPGSMPRTDTPRVVFPW